MIKNLFNKIKYKAFVPILTLSLFANIACYNEEEPEKPFISEFSYSSQSSRNSVNKIFVTGENIDVLVKLNENADLVYLIEEREFENANSTYINKMEEISDNTYTYSIPSFYKPGILYLQAKIEQGENTISSEVYKEPIFMDENMAHNIIKLWLDNKIPANSVDYEENYTIGKYPNREVKVDFYLKESSTKLRTDGIIQYVGENDSFYYASEEKEYLTSAKYENIYIYPYDPLPYYSTYPDDFTFEHLTTKSDLETSISKFYDLLDY